MNRSERDQNVFHGARQFMHRWDFFAKREAPSAIGQLRVASKRSAAGNINMQGTEYSSGSVMFVPNQEGFELAIEAGVRELVLSFARKFDLITYTSCEGHRYPDGRRPDCRCIGVLPRTAQERHWVHQFLSAATFRWNGLQLECPITSQVLVRQLVDRDALLEAIDVFFLKQTDASWDEYFECLDDCTHVFIDVLNELRASMCERPAGAA